MTKTNDFQGLTDRTHALARLMMKMTDGMVNLSTFVGVFPPHGYKAFATTFGWAGPEKEESRAPIIVEHKILQLLTLPPYIKFAKSPVTDLCLNPDFRYPGAVMKLVDGKRYVAGGSAQSGTTDLIVASTLMYAMEQEVCCNHFGLTFGSQQEQLEAVQKAEKQYNVKALYSASGQVGDESFHHRFYVPVEDAEAPNGVWFIELRWFPNKTSIEPRAHWDFVTSSPYAYLQFVGKTLGPGPMIWDDAKPGEPEGMVKTANRTYDIAVMARNRWFDPDELN